MTGFTYKTLSLQVGSQRQGVVALVVRVGALEPILGEGGVEGVVVGDVGGEAADLLALAGELEDLGELLGGCCRTG